jgi:hypothetical protein
MQLLNPSEALVETLEAGGWRLDAAHGEVIVATHPRLGDQAAARAHLRELGLLTSPVVRVEFEYGAREGATAGRA